MNDIEVLKLKNIRLAALDLDGTVLTNDKRLTARTAAAIEQASANGTEVVFVTGRPFFGVPDELRQLKGVRYIISSNGAVVTELSGAAEMPGTSELSGAAEMPGAARTIYSALLDRRTAADITLEVLRRGLLYSVYTGGLGWCDPKCFAGRLDPYIGTPIEDYIRQSVRQAEDIFAVVRKAPQAPENIWIQEKSTAARDELHELIKRSWKVNTVVTSPTDIEIGSTSAGKGRALTWLAAKLGITRDQMLAMGDNFNDLEMFEASGVAAAMGNSPAAIREAADLVAPSNEMDGVAAVLECIGVV